MTGGGPADLVTADKIVQALEGGLRVPYRVVSQ